MAMSAYYLKGVQKTNVELMEIFSGYYAIFRYSYFWDVFNVYVPWNCFYGLPEVLFAD